LFLFLIKQAYVKTRNEMGETSTLS